MVGRCSGRVGEFAAKRREARKFCRARWECGG
jgi:hypothetical protein